MKRLLFIAHRVPYPPDKGERVRAFNEIKALATAFRVTLAALEHGPDDGEAAAQLKRWCEKVITAPAGGKAGLVRGAVNLVMGKSATEGFFWSGRLLRALLQEADREPFDLVLAYSSSTLPYALAVPAGARAIDLIDVDSAKWASYADASRWPTRWVYRREERAVRRLEQQALEQCDAVALVSEAEVRLLDGGSRKVIAVGNGVDTEYFKPMERPPGPPSLVFTGTMDYRPNVEGVCWFVREVWPELKRRVPDLIFTIVGRDPTPEVRRLAEVPGVAVTGTVADVRPHLAEATIAVVPLRIARGIQNKILEAMAMGRAVVASPAALEGLEVAVGTEALQADAGQAWQRTILDLLADPARRAALGQAARQRVVADYSWDARMEGLVALCQQMALGVAAVAVPQATVESGDTEVRGPAAAPSTRRR